MKSLIEAVEAWIDTRIMNKTEIAFVKRRIDDLEYLQGANAKRISSLEGELLELKLKAKEVSSDDAVLVTEDERLDAIESRLDDLDSGIEDANSTAENAYSECSDLEYRVDELEQLHKDEIDPEDIERTVLRAVQDDISEHVISAVRSELDAVDFRVTIER